ncbi:hypothetical protein AXG93_1335s1290 [Marchantia polymorpha subsp. ruderalis]|uniref:Uncharacterized protein n=1 Tax=Marchantia polymorpha subsp. ruderalis TaxID=1480154 RepID=A0A176W6F5_MARPO|nr:hypothetical protein AXG93_1335s1290 [Marchantia polymorpha subsp. ruderalis]
METLVPHNVTFTETNPNTDTACTLEQTEKLARFYCGVGAHDPSPPRLPGSLFSRHLFRGARKVAIRKAVLFVTQHTIPAAVEHNPRSLQRQLLGSDMSAPLKKQSVTRSASQHRDLSSDRIAMELQGHKKMYAYDEDSEIRVYNLVSAMLNLEDDDTIMGSKREMNAQT